MSHTKPLPSLVDLESLCVDHTRWHRRGAGANHAVCVCMCVCVCVCVCVCMCVCVCVCVCVYVKRERERERRDQSEKHMTAHTHTQNRRKGDTINRCKKERRPGGREGGCTQALCQTRFAGGFAQEAMRVRNGLWIGYIAYVSCDGLWVPSACPPYKHRASWISHDQLWHQGNCTSETGSAG